MKNTQLNNSGRSTDKIGYYFLIGTKELLVITVRGIIYNVGLLACLFTRASLLNALPTYLQAVKSLKIWLLLF